MATFSSSGTVSCWVALLLAGAAAAAFAQDTVCAASLAAPVYPPLAREARVTGEVRVQFEVSGELKARDTKCTGHELLCESAKAAVQRTTFDATCAKLPVELVLYFMLEGEPAAEPITTITFRTPNRYLITSNPAPAKRNRRSSVQRPCATCSQPPSA
jgi:hypothetical protein